MKFRPKLFSVGFLLILSFTAGMISLSDYFSPEIVVSNFNYLEALLWIVLSVFCFLHSKYLIPARNMDIRICGIVFLLFGISDLIEAKTGAWWKPWWLFVWKASCLVFLLIFYLPCKKKPGKN